MKLGEKLRLARQESGLSQRQLCGGEITRNMLSQIEHGTARPSMDTLTYLACQLGKPVSYFLEEDAVTSPNQDVMSTARAAYAAGDMEAAGAALERYRGPDGVFEEEYQLLYFLTALALARQALNRGQLPYARELLTRAGKCRGSYLTAALERERLLLLAEAKPEEAIFLASALGEDDRELLLRARAALYGENPLRAAALLEAAEDHTAPEWNLLRGEAYLAEKDWARAAACYREAEQACPHQTAPRLEQCYRELEDYKMAYFYACKQREKHHQMEN